MTEKSKLLQGEQPYPHQTINLLLLAIVYALFVGINSGHLAVSTLASSDMGASSLTTLPVAVTSSAQVISCVAAARIMRRTGRKIGFLIGGVFCGIAGVICYFAIKLSLFWLLLVGSVCLGVFGSFSVFIRYEAADVCAPSLRSRAVSWVIFGGACLSLIGPQAAAISKSIGGFGTYYIACGVMGAIYFVLVLLIRPPPSRMVVTTIPNTTPRDLDEQQPTHRLANRATSYTQPTEHTTSLHTEEPDRTPTDVNYGFVDEPASSVEGVPIVSAPLPPRSVWRVIRSTKFVIAVTSQVCGYWSMVVVMTATPLAMRHQDLSFHMTVLTIQLHLLGMFVPGFFTGFAIDRFGTVPVITVGTLFLCASSLLLLAGTTLGHFIGGLLLLGVGWNFAYISGTRLLLEVPRSTGEASSLQAVNEVVVQCFSASAALMSGVLFHRFGWYFLVALGGLMALVALVVVLLVRAHQLLRNNSVWVTDNMDQGQFLCQ